MELSQLYTSRWQNKALADLEVVPVGISRGTPRWSLPYSYRRAYALAPSREAFAQKDEVSFKQVYCAGLEQLGIERILADLTRLSAEHGGKSLALLCYEDVVGGDWCHRRIFAAWFEEQTGLVVPELIPEIDSPSKPPTLF